MRGVRGALAPSSIIPPGKCSSRSAQPAAHADVRAGRRGVDVYLGQAADDHEPFAATGPRLRLTPRPRARDRDGNRLIVDCSARPQLAVSLGVLDAVRNRFVCGQDDLVAVMAIDTCSIKPVPKRGTKPCELF